MAKFSKSMLTDTTEIGGITLDHAVKIGYIILKDFSPSDYMQDAPIQDMGEYGEWQEPLQTSEVVQRKTLCDADKQDIIQTAILRWIKKDGYAEKIAEYNKANDKDAKPITFFANVVKSVARNHFRQKTNSERMMYQEYPHTVNLHGGYRGIDSTLCDALGHTESLINLQSILDEEEYIMVRMILAGYTHREIAYRLNVVHTTIGRRAKKVGEKLLQVM